MNARDVMQAIRKHYGESAVIVTEVANATGSGATRHIDALALGCWPSRGLFVHAIEIKVSAADLKKELATPAKADAIAKYCDRMYLATPKGLVKDLDSLPPAWGLYEADGSGLKTRKPSAEIEALPLSRGFLMAVVRAAVAQHSEEAAIEERISAAVSKARADIRKELADSAVGERAHQQRIADELGELRQAVGYYRKPSEIGKAMDLMRAISGTSLGRATVAQIATDARRIAEQADALVALAQEVFAEQKESA